MMNKTISHTLVSILFAFVGLLFTSDGLFAQVTETRQLSRGFKINKSTIVDIGNKYGDISIETWSHDSVRVEIFVKVSEKSRDRLRKKIEGISFELTQSGHYVVINTQIGDNRNILLSEFTKLKENIGMGESQVEINMKVKMPDNLDLRVSNKFGNVFIYDYKGDVSFDVANGKLKANNLSGYVNMKMNFGDATINSLDAANLEVFYGKLVLASARKLRVVSKTSDIIITEVSQLTVNSSRDTYRIRMIDDLETQSSWTDFSISDFKNRSDVRMNYGDITIENIRSSFESIYIDARSSKINLMFDRKADVNFDIISNKEINLPINSKIDTQEQIDPAEKLVRYVGRTGDIKVEAPRLILKTTSGDISIIKK
jgi:hypothetical protein